MAIHEEHIRKGSGGILKTIDEDAIGMMLENVQKHQYNEPEKSMIRELVSNALDATREKQVAFKILRDKSPVSDFYITRNEGLYKDSNFMPEYYDINKLHPTDNIVRILYTEKPGGRDLIEISDNGVGIGNIINPISGKSRLKGSLTVGYSTKRNSSIPLGKFGIGGKAALSTGIHSYTVNTVHNGKRYKFEVFDFTYESLIPRFNLQTGKENIPFTLPGDATIMYYEESEEYNGTTIIVEAKRHHRKTFINAVQSQLLYFDSIEMSVIKEDGSTENVPIQAKIQYEDNSIIIAENNIFSKPHFVIGGMNYGYINYEQLELNEIIGSVGFKIKAESVEINPSRESLIWNDKTRETVLKMQHTVETIANQVVQKEMSDNDLIGWLKKCSILLGEARDYSSIVGKLIGLVTDKENIVVKFPLKPEIKFIKDPNLFFSLFDISFISSKNTRSLFTAQQILELKRDTLKSWQLLNNFIYLQEGNTSSKKDRFLLALHPEGYVKIVVNEELLKLLAGGQRDLTEEELEGLEEDERNFKDYRKKKDELQLSILSLLRDSEYVQIYENIEVPEKYGKEEEEKDEEENSEAKNIIKKLSPSELRKINEQTICVYPKFYWENAYRRYSWSKEEPKIKDILLDDAKVVYGFQEDEKSLHFLATLFEDNSTRHGGHVYYNSEFKLLRVSKSAEKYFKHHTYVRDFILTINPEEKSITMDNMLIKWHTGRKIYEKLPKLRFLSNFNQFNPAMTDLYNKLRLYQESNFKPKEGIRAFGYNDEIVSEFDAYANKVIELQLYIHKNPTDTEGISTTSRSLFESDEADFKQSTGIDMAIYELLLELESYAKPYKNIFNYVEILCSPGAKVPDELETEIWEIINNKDGNI